MVKLPNAPQIKLALLGVSRDCFPVELTKQRLQALAKACRAVGLQPKVLKTVIENENDTAAALAEAREAGCNAAVLFLGNFGPEGPTTIFAQKFDGPCMLCAAAEETKQDLINGRGDALCGMLNASYNVGLRHLTVHIPQMPVGLPDELAEKIAHFQTVAQIVLGVRGLKIYAFGPRPWDFYACNAPIQGLYDIGVEVIENSELDLFELYRKTPENDPKIKAIVRDMTQELGEGNTYPDLLPKLARLELTLLRFAEENLGTRQYAVFADKCWPAFEPQFGFVPCYVNSRLSTRGMPVACEVDIYGAFSEYFCYIASQQPATLLDLNNSVPKDMITQKTDLMGAVPEDLFMGFHCGNTPSCCMKNCSMKYQLIMNRLMEPDADEPDITRGTLEGQLRPSETTIFRVQGRAGGGLSCYVAEGNILDIDPRSFGCIGVFAIPHFARFYRHALIGRRFPHHAATAWSHCGKALVDAVTMLGIAEVNVPLPQTMLYDGENPFEVLS